MEIQISVKTWKELVKICAEHHLDSLNEAVEFAILDMYQHQEKYDLIKEFIK